MSTTDIAIKVQNLSKCYQIYDNPRDRLKQFVAPRLQRLTWQTPKQYFHEFWALRDVSFEVKKGETVGIIGRNGSGKSTLLQMICGTLNPTAGSVETYGRIAALLELGSGFNPEFTGRENVYMNASVLGLSNKEIDARFDDIVAFADIGDFIEQSVKTYSSGMMLRLAFAVAINVQPDILVIDEALAVGDITFQAKCMTRLKKLMDTGTTVLFVSHDTSSVRNFCQKVLWLSNGEMKAYGDPELTIGKYVAEAHLSINNELSKSREDSIKLESSIAIKVKDPLADLENYSSFSEGWRRYGDGRASILNVALLNSNSLPVETICLREDFLIRFLVWAEVDVENPVFGFSFKDLKGNQLIGSMTTNHSSITVPDLLAGHNYLIEIRGQNILAQGAYTLTLGIESIVERNIAHEYIDVVENAIVFRSSFGSDIHDIFPALVWQDVDISIQKIDVN
ncbi:ABC transporter ATP-binding protein [Methylobacter sp. S3L5C]|uniref:ABC transporter ATP-binding protein n=1 Tax=Methylobacter sp. S3L5C TaxID=2839024 RepID=UPI001FABED3B|nr:ABC transporter ATP-binding protein [Methylobacter sp. S3L5C]UOA09536.1 ABC transporter ATP-binding protein [Methylobacter sp. S3L5C]